MVVRTSATAATRSAPTVVEGDAKYVVVATASLTVPWESYYAEVEKLAKSITTTKKSDIYVFYGTTLAAGAGWTSTVRLKRDDSTKDSMTTTSANITTITDVFKDAGVAAGTYEYEITVQNSNGNVSFSSCFIHIVAVSV